MGKSVKVNTLLVQPLISLVTVLLSYIFFFLLYLPPWVWFLCGDFFLRESTLSSLPVAKEYIQNSCQYSSLVVLRIAVFSVSVFYDERIVVVAEQRPDASEEDSFQWMSRVLQVSPVTKVDKGSLCSFSVCGQIRGHQHDLDGESMVL